MTAPIAPGDMLAGKYRVERVLGEGGMGIVVAARHTTLDQRVAVKFMRAEALAGDGVDRFLREARAAARLTGDHVVRVTDVGTLDDGAPYIVMEYLEGRDLGSVLSERGKLPPAEAGAYLLEACEAMSEAHEQGIVHRDLKPENLFLVRRPGRKPLIKVLDFGISKLLETSDALSSTKTSVMMGSPAYMSPEQMQSPKYVDGRTDIWSLGVILYQLVAGRLPYNAESVLMLSALVLTTEPPRLESVAPDVPPALAEVVHRCLCRDLSRRFQTVDELAEALAASIDGLGPVAATWGRDSSPSLRLGTPTPVPRHTPMPNDATLPASAVMRTPVPPVSTLPETPSAKGGAPQRGGRWMVPALLGVALIGGVIAFAVVKGGAQAQQPQPAIAPTPAPPPTPPPVVETAPTPTPTPVPPPIDTAQTPSAPAVPPAAPIETTQTPSASAVPPAATAAETTPAHKKKPVTKKKRPKERPDDDPFGTLQ